MATYRLRPYQEQIVEELSALPSKYLLMGTGTGKTITSAHMVRDLGTRSLLVVCPHNAMEQWKHNIRTHFPYYTIVDFKPSWTSTKINDYLKTITDDKRYFIVINYDMVYKLPQLLKIVNNNWSIIADEIHRIKNYGTAKKPVKRTEFMLKLGTRTYFKIGLTATPTQGKFGGYIDYYTQLKFLGYIDMSYKEFKDRYCVEKLVSYGTMPYPIKEIEGYKNTHEIDNILATVSRRYVSKYDDFEPQFIEVKLDRAKNYSKTVREKAYVKDDKRIVISNTARARIAKKTIATGTIMGKSVLGEDFTIDDNTIKLDWLEEFLQDTDEVVVIPYMYNVELFNLVKLCEKLGKRYIVINGKTKNKYELVHQGNYDVVIGQFQAMSEALDGLHLFSHIMVFFSMPESSIHYSQMIGRIDRDGQTKVPMYYFLIMEKTIDEAIYESIKNKVEFSEETLNKLEV